MTVTAGLNVNPSQPFAAQQGAREVNSDIMRESQGHCQRVAVLRSIGHPGAVLAMRTAAASAQYWTGLEAVSHEVQSA